MIHGMIFVKHTYACLSHKDTSKANFRIFNSESTQHISMCDLNI